MIHYADYTLLIQDLTSLCGCVVCVADNTSDGVRNGGNTVSSAGGSAGSQAPSPGPSALYQAPLLPAVAAAAGPAAGCPPVVAAGATAALSSAVVAVAMPAAVAVGPPVVAAGANVAVPSAVVAVAVPAAVAAPAVVAVANNGGAGRPQEMCGNRADGCHNHKVLNCTYGLCGVCCAASKRDPRCGVAKHYNKNTHK